MEEREELKPMGKLSRGGLANDGAKPSRFEKDEARA
jgi:hypothetical protein